MKNMIFLRKFNNYYDRKVKRLESLDEYLAFEYVIKQAINFSPADGLNTKTTTNWTDEWTPDYALIVDELGEIISRWFVIEFDRTRNGQYMTTLRRDLMADYIEKIKDAPVLVEKANLEMGDPLIYNSESLEYNQIKKGEHLLKDKTGKPWIVGYVASDHNYTAEGTTISTVIDRGDVPDIGTLGLELNDNSDPSLGGKYRVFNGDIQFDLGVFYRANNMSSYESARIHSKLNYLENAFTSKGYIFDINIQPLNITVKNFSSTIDKIHQIRDMWDASLKGRKTSLMLAIDTYLEGEQKEVIDKEQLTDILNLNGKLVYSSSADKYYKLEILNSTTTNYNKVLESKPSTTPLLATLDSAKNNTMSAVNGEPLPASYRIRYSINTSELRILEVPGPGTVSVKIKNGHNKLKDGPYDMFAMPYNEENMALVNAIIQELTPTNVYDVQILPYCPARYMLGNNAIVLANGTEDTDYNLIKLDDGNFSYLLWCKTSSDSFIIPYSLPTGTTPEEVKVINETEFIRLNSPNYNGSFDFNVAKNEGVDYFRVSFTYKPYSPYIQVSPNFKGLYGGEFNDARGLICNGDFSIAMTTDAWRTYEINNKNFQNTFDTQIKTMDYQHKMGMISGGIGSSLSAVGIGAGATLMTGNPVVGAVAGGLSMAGGIADLAIGDSVYQRNKQSQKDIFRFSLSNIKARPDTLNKISAYNINNKYYPFVEFYGATDTEKEILLNKIKYEGMTVMKIGTIGEFFDAKPEFNYFKGQLIQNGNIDEDFHLVDAIAVELEKGVYL